MRTALVIGKFWPPHRGHHALVDAAAQHGDRLVVIVCAAAGQRPSVDERALWMSRAHPTAEVIAVDDLCAWHRSEPCAPDCTGLWVDRVRELQLGSIDVVLTSEGYGAAFAAGLGADHVAFDPGRSRWPVSGTAIRADLSSRWTDLHPAVRAGLFRRVVVLGAESTGTTTLSADLARALAAPMVPEAGRTVSWSMYGAAGSMEDVVWTSDVFWRIVDAQISSEHVAVAARLDEAPGPLGPWLVCDTDTLATVAWWERYCEDSDSTAVARFAAARPADLYLVTSPSGVAFDATDPTRDGESVRLGMHDRFVELASASGRPWLLCDGSQDERLSKALSAVQDHVERHPLFTW